jgi:hypothetical protein
VSKELRVIKAIKVNRERKEIREFQVLRVKEEKTV